jgi:hypothetical protein
MAMRNLLGFLAMLVIVVLVAGYFLDWFKFSTASSDHTANVNMEVNKDKMQADAEKAKQKIKETAQDIKERVKTGTESGTPNQPQENPPKSGSPPNKS